MIIIKMPMLFLLLFGLVQTSLCRTELIDVVCTHGFLNRASARVGVLVEFDGPLRISKKVRFNCRVRYIHFSSMILSK